MLSHRICVEPGKSTKDILHHLGDVENAVIVVEDEAPVGILIAKDALRIIRSRWDIHKPVSEYMSAPVDTVRETLTISEVIEHLQKTGFKRALVVDETNRFLGALAQSDLAAFAFNHWSRIVNSRARELSEAASIFESNAKRFENDAYTDPLTGIGNRCRFDHTISAETARIQRYQSTPFGLIIMISIVSRRSMIRTGISRVIKSCRHWLQ